MFQGLDYLHAEWLLGQGISLSEVLEFVAARDEVRGLVAELEAVSAYTPTLLCPGEETRACSSARPTTFYPSALHCASVDAAVCVVRRAA